METITSLSFSVASGRGTYALLLGSGLSSAAGIPTGWDITLDLIRKIAVATKQDCGADPAGWYRETYKSEPDYSSMLDTLAKTPSDRTNLLRGYFEATAEESDQGLKEPTAAHRSIARLVAKGYFRVVVTTNFDRLLERALETEGVSPAVIGTADAAKGALPLVHSRCTLIKLHGDYLDTRIKNTTIELDSYEPEMDRLLDRVFDEYGLIVCGWSATWDKALCRAVLRCPNRRLGTFWSRKSPLTDEARSLALHRQATEIEIESADSFFTLLEEKVDAIERYSRPHPASAKLAVVSLKKFIAEDRYRIELRDLITSESERAFDSLSPLSVQSPPGFKVEGVFERMKVYEAATEILCHLLAHGAYWGGSTDMNLWRDVIGRVGGLSVLTGGNSALLALRKYPACLLFYAAGLGATAAKNGDTLKALYRDLAIVVEGKREPLVLSALPWNVIKADIASQMPDYGDRLVSINDRIYDILREPLREYLPGESDYSDTFDLFEYLTALVHLDVRLQTTKQAHAPVGRFYIGRYHIGGVPTTPLLQREGWRDNFVFELFSSPSRLAEVEQIYAQQILPRALEYRF